MKKETPESLLYALKVNLYAIETIGCNLSKQELGQMTVSDMIDDTKPYNEQLAEKALHAHARMACIFIMAYSLKSVEPPKIHTIKYYLQEIHGNWSLSLGVENGKDNLIVPIISFLLDAKGQLLRTEEPDQPAQVSDDFTASMYIENHANMKVISHFRVSDHSIAIESAEEKNANALLYPIYNVHNPNYNP